MRFTRFQFTWRRRGEHSNLDAVIVDENDGDCEIDAEGDADIDIDDDDDIDIDDVIDIDGEVEMVGVEVLLCSRCPYKPILSRSTSHNSSGK